MGVCLKLALDAINKGLEVFEVSLEKGFKVGPCDWNGAFVVVLVLDPSEANNATKEGGGKWDTIHLYDT